MKKRTHHNNAQATIEFAYCMVVVLVLLYGIVMAFRWSGVSLAVRAHKHTSTLTQFISRYYQEGLQPSPATQVNPNFYTPSRKDFDFVMPNL